MFLVGRLVPFINRISEDIVYLPFFPLKFPGVVGYSFLCQSFGNGGAADSGGVHRIDSPYDLRLILTDNQGFICGIVGVTIRSPPGKISPLTLGNFDARPHALAEFSAFLLCQACHNGQAKFTVAAHRPDVVIHKIDLYAVGLQFAGHNQRIHGISGKARDFTGHDQIELSLFCICQHFHKAGAVIDASAGNALVLIHRDDGPFRMPLGKLLIPDHLVL